MSDNGSMSIGERTPRSRVWLCENCKHGFMVTCVEDDQLRTSEVIKSIHKDTPEQLKTHSTVNQWSVCDHPRICRTLAPLVPRDALTEASGTTKPNVELGFVKMNQRVTKCDGYSPKDITMPSTLTP